MDGNACVQPCGKPFHVGQADVTSATVVDQKDESPGLGGPRLVGESKFQKPVGVSAPATTTEVAMTDLPSGGSERKPIALDESNPAEPFNPYRVAWGRLEPLLDALLVVAYAENHHEAERIEAQVNAVRAYLEGALAALKGGAR